MEERTPEFKTALISLSDEIIHQQELANVLLGKVATLREFREPRVTEKNNKPSESPIGVIQELNSLIAALRVNRVPLEEAIRGMTLFVG